MENRKKILVPIDFSEKSLLALEQTNIVAKTLNVEIVLLYVHEPTGIFSKMFSDQDENPLIENIQKRLNEFAAEANHKSGGFVSTMVAKGRASTKITEIAQMINAGFIVMGTNSEDQFNETIGGTTHRVVRRAACPVITLNQAHHFNGIRSILLPLDLSLETRQKVSNAIEMARYFKSKIHVVSVLWSKNDEQVVFKLNAQLNQVVNFISEKGIDCKAELIEAKKESSHIPEIISYAHEQDDIDLIMIMTQPENSFIEFFMDSDAQDVIRYSKIPVMSIVPREVGMIQQHGF